MAKATGASYWGPIGWGAVGVALVGALGIGMYEGSCIVEETRLQEKSATERHEQCRANCTGGRA